MLVVDESVLNQDVGSTNQDGNNTDDKWPWIQEGQDGELTGSGIPEDNGDDVLPSWSNKQEWSGGLTLAMGEEVVSERGGGAGVTISGAHTVTAQGRAELLHAC